VLVDPGGRCPSAAGSGTAATDGRGLGGGAAAAARTRGEGALVTDETSLSLTAYGKNENGVKVGKVTVQSHIAVRTTSDDQFPPAVFRGPPYLRVVLQHVDRFDDFPNTRRRIGDLMLGEVIEDTMKVVADFRRQFDVRQAQRTSLRTTGRFTALPTRCFSRKARVSCQGIVSPEATIRA